jgi:hypothetical protein
MSTRSAAVLAFPMPRDAQGDDRSARLRFAAIVRALASLAAARSSATTDAEPAATESPDVPTRRLNRLQRMFGRLRRRPVQGGKSRRHAR